MRMRIIDAIDDAGADTSLTANDDIARSLTALDALHMVAEAWTTVTPTTIRNCWKKANFVLTPLKGEKDDVEDEPELPVPPGMTAKEFDDWVDNGRR